MAGRLEIYACIYLHFASLMVKLFSVSLTSRNWQHAGYIMLSFIFHFVGCDDYRNGTEIWKNLVLNNTWNVCWHMYIITYIHERINEISFSHQYTLIRYVCTSKSFAMYAMLNCQSSHSEYLKDTYCWRIISLPEYILLSLTGNWTCDYNLNIKIPVTTVFIFFLKQPASYTL